MDTTPPPTTTPEAILAARLNVPRESFKGWRESGQLQETTHYLKEGRAYHLTAEGEAQVMHLIGITTPPPPSVKIEMLAQAAGLDFHVVKNESEALYLEDNMIKKHQPYFNNLLKADNSYVYIKITNETFPQVITTRKKSILKRQKNE